MIDFRARPVKFKRPSTVLAPGHGFTIWASKRASGGCHPKFYRTTAFSAFPDSQPGIGQPILTRFANSMPFFKNTLFHHLDPARPDRDCLGEVDGHFGQGWLLGHGERRHRNFSCNSSSATKSSSITWPFTWPRSLDKIGKSLG